MYRYYTLIYDDYNNELFGLAVSVKYTAEDIQWFIDDARAENEDMSYLDIIATFPEEIKVIFANDIESVFI